MVNDTPCHWVGLALCSACVTAVLDGVTQDTASIGRLQSAWSAFNRAAIGRLNATRDELEAVAASLGWTRSAPLLEWVRSALINAGVRDLDRS